MAEEDDYMGDLSQFLTPEASGPPGLLSKKISNGKNQSIQPSKKKSKALNWQEQRKLDREKKQQEEDEKTLAKIEAAPIPQSNIGFKLLKQMGYTPGSALGKEGSGQAEPVKIDIRRSRAGIGREDPHKEKRKREEIRTWAERRNEQVMMEEFGSRKKSQWRSRRVVVNFKKAQAALDQLENKEVVPPEKNEDEEEEGGGEEEEEEEEEITEEDLLEILMKLRDEHRYCLFCGCQYESMEALLSHCPGADEDDH
ncbi:unnamed protein product [Prunus brigantina]